MKTDTDSATPAFSATERDASDPYTIIVVDDSAWVVDLLRDLLTDEGYSVYGFYCGESVLKEAAVLSPDLILLDIDMPQMNGFEVCAQLKQHKQLADIPVIFISSYTNTEEKIKAFQSGGVDYITKPIQLDEVKARIHTHLKLRHYQHQLLAQNSLLKSTLDELKAAQSVLVQSEKMASLGQLVAGVAHEINNPVSFIYGNVHALQRYAHRFNQYLDALDTVDTGPEIRQLRHALRIDYIRDDLEPLLTGTQEASERVRDIVEDLRTFSSGQGSSKMNINLVEVINTAIRWVIKGGRHAVDLQLHLPDTLLVQAHPGQLTQVMINLLQNALDATAAVRQPCIEIAAGQSASLVWLTVADNGPGISETDINRIFDPFFTSKPVGKGTGLGLSISYSLVSEHGGELSAANRPQGGAEFRLELPQ